MRKKDSNVFRIARGANPGLLVLGVVCIGLLALAPAADAADLPTVTVIGVAPDGTETTLTDYRWLVEEDQTYHVPVNPDGSAMGGVNFDPNWQQGQDGHPGGQTLSVSFHDSYVPVVAKGCVNMPLEAACNELPFAGEAEKHYYISVVPRSGYSIGGAPFKDEDTSVTVYANQYPIETAQITVLVFEDNNSINGAPDLPREDPSLAGNTPMDGFVIVVEDGGGRYGASAGVQSLDAFANPLGTIYNNAGDVIGFEPLITGPDGRLTIRNLAPGKYGIQAVPPAGATGWQQTSTIEGTKIIDAWVKANEPPFFAEFGPPGFHAFIGFVKAFDEIPAPAAASATLEGTIVNNHLSRPPDYAFYSGECFGHTTPWVGLNEVTGGLPGRSLYAAPTDDECNFTIPSVPPGDYQLVVFDSAMDIIIAFKGVTIDVNGDCNTPNGSCNFVQVPVFQWFHRQEHRVFNDVDGDGVWDADEGPMNDQANILRWRDGTVYQENVTDFTGAYTFDQVFPFFAWLVAEIDFARFEATGLTAVVDNGGAIPGSSPGFPGEDDFTFGRTIAPQDQTNPVDPACVGLDCTETTTYKTELGPVLTAGFQGFIGQTSAFIWGKRHYEDLPDQPGIGANGGISGIVFYAITRAENDPALAAAEPWEPGIPGVEVNLYSSDGLTLLNSTTTDSWDDSIPTGCKWGDLTGGFQFSPDGANFFDQDCYDGLRAFNQVRPAVFDGGYAFDDICNSGFDGDTCSGTWQGYIPAANYIVEVVAPPGYEILKPQDKNVDFGDEYLTRAKGKIPIVPQCVGVPTLIPRYLTLFPDAQVESPFVWDTGAYVPLEMPLCDRKEVILTSGKNGAADFWLFTEVPVAAHANGFILDDTQNEFDPNSPNFGEKYAPPFVPVTIRDWTGRILSKTLSDQYGTYNFLAPSTITTNLPAPSGMSPNMLTTCMNDPGDDPNNPDPNWNQQYSTFCYNFQYMPGVTTYLDTPVVPVAAFTGPDQFPLDCEFPDGTPRIWEVRGDGNGPQNGGESIGPYVFTSRNNGRTRGGETVTITSMGTKSVQDPTYCNAAAGADACVGANTTNKFVSRDYGFGITPGQVYIGDVLIPATSTTWGSEVITLSLPNQLDTGQLRVVRGDNNMESITAVTVQIGLRGGNNNTKATRVTPSGGTFAHDIQDAIDMAFRNDLILVGCGQANEMVVMWKPVQLQGSGECSIINAVKAPTDKLAVWRGLVDGLVSSGNVDLLPGQEVGPGAPEPTTLWTEEGAGILVLAKANGANRWTRTGNNRTRDARIDGFVIRGADTGGGIMVNGYARYLEISNNRISNNSGFYGGGIRVGHPILVRERNNGEVDYTDGRNDFVSIHNNQVVFNGGLGGFGGGVSMCQGADSYKITQNWVCGNLTLGEGGGIGHTGLSNVNRQNGRPNRNNPAPLIADNTIIFNESFFQGTTVSGGGIYIGGSSALPGAEGGVTEGSGNVQIIGNLIKGNSAGAGDGGGIRLAGINGLDVDRSNNSNDWFSVDIFNNRIVNNVAALAGGGISMLDATKVRLVHNTIAHNDSMGTAGEAFAPNSPNQSDPQPGAGIAVRKHSDALMATGRPLSRMGEFPLDPQKTHSNVRDEFADNIIWQNRQFYFFIDDASGCVPGDPNCQSTYGVCPDVTGLLACPDGNTVVYDDLGVLGTGDPLDAIECDPLSSCIFTGADPAFVSSYVNGDRSSVFQPELTSGIQTPAAFDEGGNFIRLKYGPLALWNDATPNDGFPGVMFGDYLITGGSPAIDAGIDLTGDYPELGIDYDGDARPIGADADIGADEVQ